jgi:hypothetical protein
VTWDDSIRKHLSGPVDIGEEGLEGTQSLDDTRLDSRPLGGGDDPRHEIHGQRTFALAESERDAVAIQIGITNPRSIAEFLRAEVFEDPMQLRVRDTRKPTVIHLVEGLRGHGVLPSRSRFRPDIAPTETWYTLGGMQSWQALRMWPARRWGIAGIAAVLSTAALAIPTALIPNPVFGRAIEPEWWSWPVTILTGILAGLLVATYIATPRVDSGSAEDTADDGNSTDHLDRAGKAGVVGGLVSFFAVGCPVCNKLVLIALGTTGAVQWFAPIQPILAVAAIGLLLWALRRRLVGEISCAVRTSV